VKADILVRLQESFDNVDQDNFSAIFKIVTQQNLSFDDWFQSDYLVVKPRTEVDSPSDWVASSQHTPEANPEREQFTRFHTSQKTDYLNKIEDTRLKDELQSISVKLHYNAGENGDITIPAFDEAVATYKTKKEAEAETRKRENSSNDKKQNIDVTPLHQDSPTRFTGGNGGNVDNPNSEDKPPFSPKRKIDSDRDLRSSNSATITESTFAPTTAFAKQENTEETRPDILSPLHTTPPALDGEEPPHSPTPSEEPVETQSPPLTTTPPALNGEKLPKKSSTNKGKLPILGAILLGGGAIALMAINFLLVGILLMTAALSLFGYGTYQYRTDGNIVDNAKERDAPDLNKTPEQKVAVNPNLGREIL
jgi:hypothetical protein